MPTWTRRLRFGTAALIVAVSFSAPPRAARADESASPSADALKQAREQFSQALALQTAGNWAGALALFKEVAAIKSTPQVRFNIALCEENLGRLVVALGEYELAAADARAEKAEKVAEEVGARLESLRQRIPRIVVQRGRGAEAASVSIDGVAIGDAVIGTPIPADPGPHTVEATASGFLPFKRSLKMAERRTETVVVELEPLPEQEKPAPPAQPPPRPIPTSGLRTAGFIAGGVGLASFAASGVFFYLRGATIDDLDAACGADRSACPASRRDTVDDGKLYTTLGNVGLAAGAVGVGVGLALILAGGSSTGQSSWLLTPSAQGSLAGATVSSKF